ncbi:MAG: methylmalonyl Co-A mutase-associated GTPase MeaB [Nocardioides sp.]
MASPAELVEAALSAAASGDAVPRAVARLISWVEEDSPRLREVMAALIAASPGPPTPGGSHVIGITGAPGVGKSTSTSALISALRARDRRVGVIAIDPSSPFSGGALLGDRIRMSEHATDAGVFIRSMASRGHLGGLSRATPQAVRVLGAAGFDHIIIETVGVGQSEVEVAGLADTTLVLLAPGMGDGIQAAKAGILEVGDIYVVNKADRDGADKVKRDLRSMLSMAVRPTGAWKPPVLTTVAQTGTGIEEVVDALDEHAVWLSDSAELTRRRTRRASAEISEIATDTLRSHWVADSGQLASLAASVVAGELDPYTAADRLLG